MTKESTIEISVGKATFWLTTIVILGSFAVSLIGIGAWITSVQKDIATLNLKIEDIRNDGSKLAQASDVKLQIMATQFGYVQESLVKNTEEHKTILATMEKGFNLRNTQ
ncbi:MAG: hypothetical protein WC356_02015 [Candidatus Micrarchaeia archaeon]|jgi:hypothetical protein